MSGSTVLIVDDEQTLARSAKAFLADHGYEAEVAGSGEKALELLESLQPDVVFAEPARRAPARVSCPARSTPPVPAP